MTTEAGDTAGTPEPDADAEVEPQGLPRFVTKLSTIEQQVGRHVIAALQHDETVAVLTTTVAGPTGEQHLISVPLSPPMLHYVQSLLHEASPAAALDRIPCVGFHCYVKDSDVAADPDGPGADDAGATSP